jgi:hypothetical protein
MCQTAYHDISHVYGEEEKMFVCASQPIEVKTAFKILFR